MYWNVSIKILRIDVNIRIKTKRLRFVKFWYLSQVILIDNVKRPNRIKWPKFQSSPIDLDDWVLNPPKNAKIKRTVTINMSMVLNGIELCIEYGNI